MVLRSLCAALVLLAVTAAPAAAQFTPGAAGGGDPFYPSGGNGGYEAKNYTVKLDRFCVARAVIVTSPASSSFCAS